MTIAQKIKILREVNSWTQEDLAEKLHISPNGYGRIERGEVKLDLPRLELLAKIFHLKASELIDLEVHEIIQRQGLAKGMS
ncbi:MAG: XRE family transcriptional regulator [Cytophagales bacterium]|nr:MAG: XRE family transcriptional regulator [Cytophagales bacterium]